jgi:nucleoside-diphosphate-sugar epimerase
MVIQVGDVLVSHANLYKLEESVKFKPKTSVEEGVMSFAEWYLKNRK